MLSSFRFLIILIFIGIFTNTQAQFVYVGDGPNTPDSSAALEIQSNNRGLLIPRLSASEIPTINQPKSGLLIFNTSTERLQVYNGTDGAWEDATNYWDKITDTLFTTKHVALNTQQASNQYPLTINSSANGGQLMMLNPSSVEKWHLRLQNSGAGTAYSDLGFSESNVSDNRLVLKAGGNIGIGTSDPSSRLEVNGTIHMNGENSALVVDNGTNGRLGIVKKSGISPAFAAASGNSMFFCTSSSSDLRNNISSATLTTRLIITDAGDVGIGTLTPSYKLHVNGSVAGFGAYNTLSDSTFKTNVSPIKNGLNKIMALQPKSYDWKREEYPEMNFEKGKGLGFIAQEVEPIVPEMVQIDDKGIYTLQYSELIPILVKAIQEQQAIIKSLKENNSDLKTELADQKIMLESINAKIELIEKALNAGEARK